jgi:hypothetical protein
MSNTQHSQGKDSHKKLTDFQHKPCPTCGCVCIDVGPGWSKEDLKEAYDNARELQRERKALGAVYFLNVLQPGKTSESEWIKSINASVIDGEPVKKRKKKVSKFTPNKASEFQHLPGWEAQIPKWEHLKAYLDAGTNLFLSVFYPHPGALMDFVQGKKGDEYGTPLNDYVHVMTHQTAMLRKTLDSNSHCDTYVQYEVDQKTTGKAYHRGKKRRYTCAGGITFDPKDITVAPQEQQDAISKKLLGVIKAFPSERKSASNKNASKKEIEQKEKGEKVFVKCLSERIAQPLFQGVHSAPDLTAAELKEVGLSCSHTLPAGSAYLIPQRCWHLVRNRTSNGRGSSAAWDCLYKANVPPQRNVKRKCQ